MFDTVKDQIWFFDCMWVPDARAGRIFHGLPSDLGEDEVQKRMLDPGGLSSLDSALCRVVSVAALMRRVYPNAPEDERVRLNLLWLPKDFGPQGREGEASILSVFLGAAGKFKPQLVGFGSRRRALEIFLCRSVLNGLSVPSFFRGGGEGSDYYSGQSPWHIDLKEEIGCGGSPECPPLPFIPQLSREEADLAPSLWLDGNIGKIVEFNCRKVLSRYLLWLRLARLRGFLSAEDLDTEEMVFDDMLLSESEKPGMEFLGGYMEKWNGLKEIFANV